MAGGHIIPEIPANPSAGRGCGSSTGRSPKRHDALRRHCAVGSETEDKLLNYLPDDLATLRLFASKRRLSRSDYSSRVIRALFDYDAETGDFWWKPRPVEMFDHWNGESIALHRSWSEEHAWQPIEARFDRHGYRVFSVNGVRLLAHRVAIAITDDITPRFVDHIDRCKSNNRRSNLRICSRSENNRNIDRRYATPDSHPGVRIGRKGWWQVNAKACGRALNLGLYEDFDVALAVRNASLRWIEHLNERDIECSLGASPRICRLPPSGELKNLRDSIPDGHTLFAKILDRFPFIHNGGIARGSR